MLFKSPKRHVPDHIERPDYADHIEGELFTNVANFLSPGFHYYKLQNLLNF